MTITLTKGQPVPGTPHVVVVPGDYQPADLVPCAYDAAPDDAVCAYQAQFIATGEFA